MFNTTGRLIVCASLLGLTACSKVETVETVTAEKQQISLDTVRPGELGLASVNGSVIGSEDLSVYIARTIGSDYSGFTDANLEKNVLQSFIASRAIAQKSLQSMSDDERVTLEKRVAQFREELLVKRYLLENVTPEAISNEDIRAYYDNNQDEFSGKKERLYEFLTVSPEQYTSDPAAAMALIASAKTESDWAKLTAKGNQSDSVILLRNTQSFVGGGSGSAIEKAVLGLAPTKLSKVVFENGSPYIAKLLRIEKLPAKSFEEARTEISRRLLPAHIKETVKKISAEVLASAEVKFLEKRQD